MPNSEPTLPQKALVVLVDHLQRHYKKKHDTPPDTPALFRMIAKRYDTLVAEGQRELEQRIREEQTRGAGPKGATASEGGA